MAKQSKTVVKDSTPAVFEGYTQTGVITKGGLNCELWVKSETDQGKKIRDCGEYIEIYSKHNK